MSTLIDRANLKYVLKAFFIIGTGHDIDGITTEEFKQNLERLDVVYGKDKLQYIYQEAIGAGRDPLVAAAQNLFPPGHRGSIDPNSIPSLDGNVELVMQRYGI
jgi:hypothetical protein